MKNKIFYIVINKKDLLVNAMIYSHQGKRDVCEMQECNVSGKWLGLEKKIINKALSTNTGVDRVGLQL